jgi:hypothetical protein
MTKIAMDRQHLQDCELCRAARKMRFKIKEVARLLRRSRPDLGAVNGHSRRSILWK